MPKISTFAICISLTILTLPMVGQTNFVEGTIINNRNDTLKGQIDYQEWVYNPKKIRFRTDNFSDGKFYTTKDIKGFVIAYKDERYETAIVDVNYEPTDVQKMQIYKSIDSIESDIKMTRDTVFLFTLAKGRLNLFELQQYDHDKIHFFIQDDNNRSPQELIRRSVRILKPDSSYILTIDKFKNQLKSMTADCYDANQNYLRLLYERHELLNLVKKYNSCAKASYYVKKQEKGSRCFLVWAGVLRPTTIIKDQEFEGLNIFSPKETLSNKVLPIIAISYEQNYNRLRNRLGVGGEFNLSQVDVYHRRTITYSLGEKYFDYSIRSLVSTSNLYARYYFNVKKIQPYIKGGVGLTFYSNTKLTRVQSEQLSTSSLETILAIKKLKPNYLAAIGFKYNNFILETRYEGWVNSNDIGADPFLIRRVSLLGGYSWNLNKKNAKK